MRITFFLLLLSQLAFSQTDPRIAGIDTTITRYLKEWRGAGVAVAVVEKNKIIYAKGFGYRDYSGKIPVTENTLFAIGSCTKAFTSTLLGIAVKDGLLDLDKPVHDYLPELKFYNEHLTAHVTPRDMMSHRTGLPRHDFAWYGSSANRDSLLYRIRFLPPSAELRQRYQYNNFMFLAQGVLAEKLYGKKWEVLVKEKLFTPLKMNTANFSVRDMPKTPDYSYGYRELRDSVDKMDFRDIDAVGPAGSINASVKEMANWVIAWINGGNFEGKNVIPTSYLSQAISSQMVSNAGTPTAENPDVHFANYGLAWGLASYRGHFRVEHGGNIDGFSATTCFFPSDSIGIIVLSNQNTSALPGTIRNMIADRMLGLPFRDWHKFNKDAVAKARMTAMMRGNPDSTNRKLGTSPLHSRAKYAGIYEHPGYGKITLFEERDTMWVDYNEAGKRTTSYLEHYHYDVFRLRHTDETEKPVDAVKIRFRTSNKGDIDQLQIQLEPAVKEIEFDKLPNVIKIDKAALAKYVGDYELPGPVVVKVYIKGENTLMALVPGQPDYELLPIATHHFDLKGLQGYSARFELNEKNEVVSMSFIQPNGTFKAKKKTN